MKTWPLILGLAIALILVPSISSDVGYTCLDGNIYANYTIDGVPMNITTECENGCVPISGGKYVCATHSFYIPLELFILFQVIAFVFFFITMFIHYGREDGQPLPFALLAMIIFFALSFASFNIDGLIFMLGASLNGGLGLFSLAYVILCSLDYIPTTKGH